jgi:glycosyltransferase involved in cell wall biosynthesis
MILLTPYYFDSYPERQAELDFCLQQNLQNPLITKIILFLDSSLSTLQIDELQHSKIESICCSRRCTYQDFLDYANKYLQGEIVIISNTDIFFDETLELLEGHDLSNKFLSILCWEVVEIGELIIHSQLRVTISSQDVWVFRAPLKPFIACFPLGKPGSDNRIVFEAQTVGLIVTNPAFSIRSHRLHLTDCRNDNLQERVPAPYLFIPPNVLTNDQTGKDSSYICIRGNQKDDISLLNIKAEGLIVSLPKTVDCKIPCHKSFAIKTFNKPQKQVETLTAVVISRDSEKTIGITLASLEGCYDQLIVIDVGSNEKTLAIARKYSARIVSAAEGQEFQAMLSSVKCGWVFQLEADEFVDDKNRHFLQQFMQEVADEKISSDCYLIQRRWLAPWNTTSYLINEPHGFDLQLRLFRYSQKLFIADHNSNLIHGFSEPCSDLACGTIYSLYLSVNKRSVRQQKSLRSNWLDTHGETLRLCMPELQKMQVSPLDTQLFLPTVNDLLQHLEPANLDQKVPLVTPSQKAYPVIVIDGAFFQFAKSGVSRLWETLWEEWVAMGFAQHLVVIDRAGTAPKLSGVTYRTAPIYNYSQPLLDREFNEQICQEEQASLFVSTYYTTPLSCRSVFIAYDMLPEVQGWDLNTSVWQAKRQAIGHASAYIAISESTAKDLAQLFPHIDFSQIVVSCCGVDKHFQPASLKQVAQFKTNWGITKPYFLIVGTRFQYKNILLFLLAFQDLPNREDFSIVCVGGGTLEEHFQAFARQFSMHMLNLSDQELATAYSGAEALIYPSVYEGFGMPVAEAMACGCPVITCHNSSLPEVAGEAALYVGETDVEGMIQALQTLQKPAVRQKLAEAGLEQSKRFSWSRMAEDVAHVLLKTTLPIALAPENYLLFPDWKQEGIAETLTEILATWITNPLSPQAALLIVEEDFPDDDEMTAEIFLHSILTELIFMRGLLIDNPICLLPSLYPAQWQLLLKEHCTYIPIIPTTLENRALVIQTGADQLPKWCSR